MAELLEARTWWEYLNGFGFGRQTGVDLPGEVGGTLRSWRKWARVALGTHGFGQGFSVTTLQLATAFAALANGGFMIEPFVVKEIRDEKGGMLKVRQPRVTHRVISKETAERVLAVLEAVVENGTGNRARVPGFRAAGKTGTAQRFDPHLNQYSDERPVVSFVGVVPADEPEMVIAVVLNEPEEQASGGMTAAPVFRAIAAPSLHYRNVPGRVPTIEEESFSVEYCSASGFEGRRQPGEAASTWIETGRPSSMPDLRSLPFRTALRILEGHPFRIRIEGSGRIVRQHPAAGTPLFAGQVVRLVGSTEFHARLSEEGTEGR
jgi:cell division protein FtsI (penicillin-binding protein 3)